MSLPVRPPPPPPFTVHSLLFVSVCLYERLCFCLCVYVCVTLGLRACVWLAGDSSGCAGRNPPTANCLQVSLGPIPPQGDLNPFNALLSGAFLLFAKVVLTTKGYKFCSILACKVFQESMPVPSCFVRKQKRSALIEL